MNDEDIRMRPQDREMYMSKRVALYLRVSTYGQTIENQRIELERVANAAGWAAVGIYEDAGYSGGKGRDQRPAFDRLLKDASRRKFDIVAAWSVDRLGRSLVDLVGFLQDLHAVGVDLYLHQQALDTTTPSGRAMFGMLGVFAEFERGIIRERVNAGLARAKSQGKKLGRPSLSDETKAAIHAGKAEGLSIRAIAVKIGVSVGSVHKALVA
jgi:DNA invertase Pin-like site-specific DNA recombinase